VGKFKPNLNFLHKVARGEVRHVFSYSMKRGGYWYWPGGEATVKKHAAHGFVEMPKRGPSLGKPVLVTLTDAGRAAITPIPSLSDIPGPELPYGYEHGRKEEGK
jgi:hypothetical protein